MTTDDEDSARVLNIMQGARVGPRDPDGHLAEILIALDPSSEASLEHALTEIVRDAHQG
jgi:hypothetical protein